MSTAEIEILPVNTAPWYSSVLADKYLPVLNSELKGNRGQEVSVRFFVFCLLSLLSLAGQAENFALLVGVGDYQDSRIKPLQGPAFDVKALENALKQWRFQHKNIVSLVDSKATRRNILFELDKLTGRTQPGDTIFFYYSGYGTSAPRDKISQSLPVNYGLVTPYDADWSPNGGRFESTMLMGYRDLSPRLKKLDAGGRFVFVSFDASFSAYSVHKTQPFPTRYLQPPLSLQATSRAVGGGLNPLSPGNDSFGYRNLVYISSSGVHEQALDIPKNMISRYPTVDGKPHGAFTNSLLKALAGELAVDINGDGQISYLEFFKAIEDEMRLSHLPHSPQLLPNPAQANNKRFRRALFAGEYAIAQPAPASVLTEDSMGLPRLALRASFDKSSLALLKGLPSGIIITHQYPDIFVTTGQDRTYFFDGTRFELTAIAKTQAAMLRQLQIERWKIRLLANQMGSKPFLLLPHLSGVAGNTLRKGDRIELSLLSEKPVQLLAISVDSSGDMRILAPRHKSELQMRRAWQRQDLLGFNAEPVGVIHLIVIGFTERVNGLKQFVDKKKLGYQSEDWYALHTLLMQNKHRAQLSVKSLWIAD